MKLYKTSPGNGRNPRSAFTFVEVLISTAIMLVLFTSLFAGLTMGLSVTQLTRENLRATQIMLDKLEGARLYSWSELTNTAFLKSTFTNWFFETNNYETINAQGNGTLYTGVVSVSSAPFSTSYSPSCRLVTVRVGWVSGNISRSRSMCTIFAEKGLQNYIYAN